MTPQFSDDQILAGFSGADRITDTEGTVWACRMAGSKLLVWEPAERAACQ